MTLAKRTTIGIFWNFSEQLSKRGIGILVTLLLARFLTPADYGLVGMMAVFLAVASQIMESGFKQAIIRKANATQEDFNTAFYANLVLGIFSYLLLFGLAPLISAFYNEPRLTILIRVVGVTILINAFQIVQGAILSRDIRFKAQLQATVPASIISGMIAVIMAFAGFGVWSLIVQMIVSSLLLTIFLLSMNIWRPTLKISRSSLNEMFGFGSKLFFSGLLDTVYVNMYVIVIAKIFTTTIAGQYFFSKRIKDLVINQLVTSIQTVTFPALATLQQDDAALKLGYRKIIRVTTFLLFPAMALLAAMAKPLFVVFLNEQWLPAVPYLQLMCIAGLMTPLHSINLNILQVKGRSDLFLYLEIIKKILGVFILYASIQFGVIGMLFGQIVGSVISYLPNSYFSGKMIDYPAREQIVDFFPNLLLSAIIATAVYFCVELLVMPPLVKLFIFCPLAVAAYIAASLILKLKAIYIVEQIIRDTFGRMG